MSVQAMERTVGELVAEQPSRSRVFEALGVDYCCGGKRSLADACAALGLDAGTVARLLETADASVTTNAAHTEADVNAMGLAELADHIEASHHAYLRRELPRLAAMIEKVASVHGVHYAWLKELQDIFDAFRNDLQAHMAKEEELGFPIVRDLERGDATQAATFLKTLREMEAEHEHAGDALATMRRISNGYHPPAGACGTFRAMLDGLRELERDMHQHVHKENNVLFPRAQALT